MTAARGPRRPLDCPLLSPPGGLKTPLRLRGSQSEWDERWLVANGRLCGRLATDEYLITVHFFLLSPPPPCRFSAASRYVEGPLSHVVCVFIPRKSGYRFSELRQPQGELRRPKKSAHKETSPIRLPSWKLSVTLWNIFFDDWPISIKSIKYRSSPAAHCRSSVSEMYFSFTYSSHG